MTENTKRNIVLVDTTLRDGAQSPGVRLHPDDKRKIAQALNDMGIDELEVGTPAMGATEESDIRGIADLGLDCRLSAWCRARVEDLTAARRCRVNGVHISLPLSDIHLSALGKDRAWVLDRLRTLLPVALDLFRRVTVGAQDATRSEPAWLAEFAQAAEVHGAQGLRIADTVGIGRPGMVAGLINALKKSAPGMPLEFHGHNDLGLAAANSLAAAEAGADAISVTVNGLGERAGNAALEQIVMALHLHPDLACQIDSSGLLALCRKVAAASGRPIPPNQPVVGESAFTHESGIHCHAMLRDPHAYEPFSPHSIGGPGRRFVLGSHSGGAGVRYLLEMAGIVTSPQQVSTLIQLLRGDGSS
jgi:homocitrate synthase NifV